MEIPLNIIFIDYEKTFDSVDQDTLWRILMQCTVPENLVSLICNTYQGMTRRVAHVGQMSDNFNVKTVTIPLPLGYWLDHEDYRIRQEQWYIVDIPDANQRSRLCR